MVRLDLLAQAWVEYDIPANLVDEVTEFLKENGNVTPVILRERFPDIYYQLSSDDDFTTDVQAVLYDSESGTELVVVRHTGEVEAANNIQFDDFVTFEFNGKKHKYQVRKHGLIPEPGADIFNALGVNPKTFSQQTLDYFSGSAFTTALYEVGNIESARLIVSSINYLIKIKQNGNV